MPAAWIVPWAALTFESSTGLLALPTWLLILSAGHISQPPRCKPHAAFLPESPSKPEVSP